jgi:predicted nucleic-acid-binding protein
MIAMDTSVLVRYLTNDDPAQARRAADLLAGPDSIVIPVTVLLELEWALRAVYGLYRSAILTGLRQVLGLPTIQVPAPLAVAEAITHYERGFDFADAMHLALSYPATMFTFYRRFAQASEQAGACVRLL